MQDGQGQQPKQLLSERIKNATNILVTVSHDPSVDELSAALALTLMLNKLDKHGTAVFSGKMPPAIEFLQPEKTFESTVDSLRDFIIALDKDKADRLRYKVEDDVVRIFITPYRTTIGEKDLAFSQGDFNVELIVALGVEKKEDLDVAITAHGRILHDATVVTINNNNQQSSLGSIDWTDASASSLSEMLMSLSESLKSGVLDEQIATALLTGIVSATERFSNPKTSPKVMTMSAQLMAAGANQQLISTRLEESEKLPIQQDSQPDGSRRLTEGSSEKLSKAPEQPPIPQPPVEQKRQDGEMHVEHDEQPRQPEPAAPSRETQPESSRQDNDDHYRTQEDMAAGLSKAVTPTLSVEDLKKDLAAANKEVEQAAKAPVVDEPLSSHKSDWRQAPEGDDEPLFGGTLNATADEAHEASEREERQSRNHTLLSHDGPSTPQAPLNSVSPGYLSDEPPTVDPFAEPLKSESDSLMHYEPIDTHGPTIQPLPPQPQPFAPAAPTSSQPPTLAELEANAHNASVTNPLNDARAAVNAALDSLPFNPANQPLAAQGAQSFSSEPLHTNQPDDNTFAPPPVGSSSPILPPPPPPLPDFSTLPPLPPEPGASFAPAQENQFQPAPEAPSQAPLSPAPSAPQPSNDPGQFKLPGQA